MAAIKQYLVGILFIGLPIFGSQPNLPAKITPENTVLRWDWHHVVAAPDFMSMCKEAYNAKTTLAKIGGQSCLDCYNKITGKETPAITMLLGVIKLLLGYVIPHKLRDYLPEFPEKGSTGEAFYYITKNYSEEVGQLVFTLSSQCTRISGTDAIIKQLHELGYVQRLASNMGSKELEHIQKNALHMHDILACFTQDENGCIGTTIEFDELAGIPLFEKKPSQQYFDYDALKFPDDQEKLKIFIDDQEKNVIAARAAGWYAILFKNPEQLRKDLKDLGMELI